MEHRHAVAESSPEAADGLRRERDLRDEHDDATTSLERGRCSLQVDLGLAAPGRSVQEHVTTRSVERGDDAVDGVPLGGRQLLRLGLAGKRIATRRLPWVSAARAGVGSDESQRARGRRAVVVGKPERKLDERGRHAIDDLAGVGDRNTLGSVDVGRHDNPANATAAERDRQTRRHGAISSGTSYVNGRASARAVTSG